MSRDHRDEKARREDDNPQREGEESPNVDMLRRDIDTGKTGDKVGFPDPAAAPLGTDAEAGGNPVSEDELRVAREQEKKRPDERRASRDRPNSAANDD